MTAFLATTKKSRLGGGRKGEHGMKKVIIFGNNEPASVNHYYLSHDSQYRVAGFTIDPEYLKEESLHGLPVLPFDSIEKICPPDQYLMALPLGYRKLNRFRMEKYSEAKAKGYQFANYISSKATVWKGLSIGENCFIYENSIIGLFARLGNNVIINQGCHIGHHSSIGDHCFVSSHAVVLGDVSVGPFCVLGSNSTVTDHVVVGRECVIGAGVTISKNTVEKGFYVNRAPELIRKRSDELTAVLTWPVK